GMVTVTGAGTYNAPALTGTQVGTYTWHASYSGDDFNNGAVDDGTNESVTTVKASPAIITTASATAGGGVGTAVISDTATLSGGYMVAAGSPAPTLTFQLIAPNGNQVYAETQNVTGPGNYSTTGSGTGSQ